MHESLQCARAPLAADIPAFDDLASTDAKCDSALVEDWAAQRAQPANVCHLDFQAISHHRPRALNRLSHSYPQRERALSIAARWRLRVICSWLLPLCWPSARRGPTSHCRDISLLADSSICSRGGRWRRLAACGRLFGLLDGLPSLCFCRQGWSACILSCTSCLTLCCCILLLLLLFLRRTSLTLCGPSCPFFTTPFETPLLFALLPGASICKLAGLGSSSLCRSAVGWSSRLWCFGQHSTTAHKVGHALLCWQPRRMLIAQS